MYAIFVQHYDVKKAKHDKTKTKTDKQNKLENGMVHFECH